MASTAEQTFLQAAFADQCRPDGRTREQYRTINVATGFLAQCNGSARVQIGVTDVVVGVKVEIATPSTSHPDCGRLEVHVASSAVADAGNQGRGSDSKDAAMAVILTQALEGTPGSKGVGIDLTSLCISKGKKCWQLYIDCIVLNDDGNVLDALGAAVRAALLRTGLPSVHVTGGDESSGIEGELEVDGDETQPLEGTHTPVIVTVHRIGGVSVVDVSAAEAGGVHGGNALHVAVSPSGRVCGVTQTGSGGGVDPSVLLEMIQQARTCALGLIAALDTQVEKEAAEEATEEEEDMQQ